MHGKKAFAASDITSVLVGLFDDGWFVTVIDIVSFANILSGESTRP
jgi:hypothetical protein